MTSPRPFSRIDTWVFDLDNTLYPHHVNLWQQVDARIGEFISAYLKISPGEARVIQKDYYRRYGTSMRGMMTEHGVHADDYLAYVHKIDHSPLEPNPAMGAAIAQLPGRKLILTNGSTDHAGAVLERLGITEHFEAVFDIIAAELEPKPAPQTYDKFLRVHGVDPAKKRRVAIATVTAPVAMNVAVATRDERDNRETPHTPWPEVQPPPTRVPNPTSRPATISTGVG